LQGGVCVIKSLRSGWSRASALAADAASSAQEMLEESRQEALGARPASERARTGRGKHPDGQGRSKPQGQAPAQVDDDCVWVEREPIPWQTSSALDESEFRSMFDAAGVLRDLDTLRRRAYYGGLAPAVRREGWKWLLGCYPGMSTRKDREALLSAKRQEYLAYKRQWQSITPEQQARFAKVAPPLSRRSAAQIMCTRRRGRGVVYVAPGCFAHPKSRAFWLGGECEGGQLSVGRRAQGQ